MSALLRDDLPFSRPAYSPDSRWVPVPTPLMAYVRSEAHFAAVLGALTNRTGDYTPGTYHGARLACARDILRRLAVNLYDPIACDLLLLLFPPVTCDVCQREFLRESSQRAYCSDRCRRIVQCEWKACRRQARVGQPSRPRSSVCVVCGAALTPRQCAYCGDACMRVGRLERQRARRAQSTVKGKGNGHAI